MKAGLKPELYIFWGMNEWMTDWLNEWMNEWKMN